MTPREHCNRRTQDVHESRKGKGKEQWAWLLYGDVPNINTRIIPLPTEVVVHVIPTGILLKGHDPICEAGWGGSQTTH
jgi:hypothetical protein